MSKVSKVKKTQPDKFWYQDMSILIRSDRLTEFFPTVDQTLEERFNAIVRLGLYCSVILYYYHRNVKYFSIVIGTMLLTLYVYRNNPRAMDDSGQEGSMEINTAGVKATTTNVLGPGVERLENEGDDKKCTRPTLDNPFMNVTMKDYLNIDPKTQEIVDRPEACDTTDVDVKRSMDEMFNHNLFKDVNDVFGRMNSQRQFYTMPNTKIPNAQDEFAKWLYANPKTCKEDQEFCLRYEDIRAKRPVFVDPTQNPVNTKRDEGGPTPK